MATCTLAERKSILRIRYSVLYFCMNGRILRKPLALFACEEVCWHLLIEINKSYKTLYIWLSRYTPAKELLPMAPVLVFSSTAVVPTSLTLLIETRHTPHGTVCRTAMHVCMYGHRIQHNIDQPDKVANPARVQLNRKKWILSCPRLRLRIWSRETDSAVPARVSLIILHTQAESSAYSWDSSRFPRRCPFIYTATRHRVSLESRNCVSMAFTAESSPAQRQ